MRVLWNFFMRKIRVLVLCTQRNRNTIEKRYTKRKVELEEETLNA